MWTINVDLLRFHWLTFRAMPTVDKDLKRLRNDRWNKAFSEQRKSNSSARDDVNRKATSKFLQRLSRRMDVSATPPSSHVLFPAVVIEHLIQASDVAHTMQVRS